MNSPLLLLLLLPLLLLLAVGISVKNYYSFLALSVSLACLFFFQLFNNIWLKPQRVKWRLQKQGIKGPQPSLFYGNVPEMQRIQAAVAAAAKKAGNCREFIAHDYTSTLFPYFEQWRKQYGPVYTYSTGNKQHLYVNQPELVREMNQSRTLDLGKPCYVTKRLAPMLGNGIIRSNGHVWAQQRKIVAPEFFMDKVKGMVGLMMESAQPLVGKWEGLIDEAEGGVVAEIRVDEDLRSLSADVIARACFGSSYFKGKHIFSKLRTLQKVISNQGFLFGLPSFGFLSTGKQKEISNLEREIEGFIWDAIKEREQDCTGAPSTEKDLMQLILEGAMSDDHFVEGGGSGSGGGGGSRDSSSKRFIVDNCKNIYFAGHETTAVAASWSLMLLALHPEWQTRVREEATRVCHGGSIDAESLSKLKTMTMVIQEALRLYPPAAFVSREALEETRIAHITIPKGVCTWTLIPTLHRDPNNWGPDANEFNPERFANGVSSACKIPHTYVPFGLGPRLCLGRNFAMVQLKLILALVVSKFTFSLSPEYRHAPAYNMVVEPGHGVHILVRRSKLD